MNPVQFDNISVDNISFPHYKKKNISVSVLRLDKIHPVISGNKWFKLRFYIKEAQQQNKTTIATFGGAWSNHIVATAAACKENGIYSIGIIRGEKPETISETLATAQSYGMKLIFIPRQDYKNRIIPATSEQDIKNAYLIDEGGYGMTGAEGAATISSFYPTNSPTHIVCVTGTGTTMAGLIKSSTSLQQVIGVSVLKNNSDLEKTISGLLTAGEKSKSYRLFHNYHFGGYAKYTPELISFMNEFYSITCIPSDFVYTGKLFYAVNDLIASDFFPADSRLLVIHSGGLQGNKSLPRGMLIF